MSNQFSDLISIADLQYLLEVFYSAHGIPVEVVDLERKSIARAPEASIWRDLLVKNIEKHHCFTQIEDIDSSQLIDKMVPLDGCLEGLAVRAQGINFDGQHLATLILGPAFLTEPNDAEKKKLFQAPDLDAAAYPDAAPNQPVVLISQAESAGKFLVKTIQLLVEKGAYEARAKSAAAASRKRETKRQKEYHALEKLFHERTVELEKANEALQEGEQRFRVALIDTPVVVFNQDLDLRYTWVYNLQNYAGQPVLGKTDWDVFSPEDARRMTDLKKRVMAAGKLAREEISVTVDGKTLYYDMTLDPLFNLDGEVTGLTCAATDITGRIQIENALRQTNAGLLRTQKRIEQILFALQAASSSLELDSVLENILNVMIAAVDVDVCSIYLNDRERGKLNSRAIQSTPGTITGDQGAGESLSVIEETIAAKVFSSGEPLASANIGLEPGLDRDVLQSSGIKSVLAVPLKVAEHVLGVAALFTTRNHQDFSQDEVELAQGIANSVALAVENARLYEEMRRRLAESEGLQRIAKGLLQKIGLQEVLEIVCAEAMQLTGAKGSAVLLLNEDGELSLTHSAGTPKFNLSRLPVEGSFAGRAVQMGEHVWVGLQDSDSASSIPELQGKPWLPGLHSLLAVPLQLDQKVIGVLDILNKPGEITQEDIRIIDLFADQAAIIIEHVRLQHQAEQLAVLEERQRLARELHDSVTQALYSVTLYADAARMALSAKKWEALERNMQEVRNMAREAMYDMRLLIFELRPFMLEKEGLVSALRARLAAVEGRSGLQTDLTVEGERRLPGAVEEEIYRIAQEGLNNVVKHAAAKRVLIHLKYEQDYISLEVSDDGTGFDMNNPASAGGLGLRGINERVQRLKGSLEVESGFGKGTRLKATIPVPTMAE